MSFFLKEKEFNQVLNNISFFYKNDFTDEKYTQLFSYNTLIEYFFLFLFEKFPDFKSEILSYNGGGEDGTTENLSDITYYFKLIPFHNFSYLNESELIKILEYLNLSMSLSELLHFNDKKDFIEIDSYCKFSLEISEENMTKILKLKDLSLNVFNYLNSFKSIKDGFSNVNENYSSESYRFKEFDSWMTKLFNELDREDGVIDYDFPF